MYKLSNDAATLEVRTSDDIGAEFYAAFVAAQAAIAPAVADKVNTYHRSRYADLCAVIEAARPHLAENGLAVLQFPFTRTGTIERSYRDDDGKPVYEYRAADPEAEEQDDGEWVAVMETVPVVYVTVRTRVIHQSGQWLENDLEIPVSMGKNPAQAVGVATTYAQRYAYRAIVGVPSEDDDGQALQEPEFQDVGRQRQPARSSRKPQGPSKPQGKAGRIQSVIDRLNSAENLATLRHLHEAAVREIEKDGTEADMQRLVKIKDENKARLSAESEEGEPEQQPPQNDKPQANSRGINF